MVIVAVQPDRLARLAPPAAGIDREALARLGSSPIVNLHFVFDRRVTDHEFAAGVGTPVQWLFDRTGSAGLERGQYLVISLSAADDELGSTSTELRERYERALAGAAARRARGHDRDVLRDPRARRDVPGRPWRAGAPRRPAHRACRGW